MIYQPIFNELDALTFCQMNGCKIDFRPGNDYEPGYVEVTLGLTSKAKRKTLISACRVLNHMYYGRYLTKITLEEACEKLLEEDVKNKKIMYDKFLYMQEPTKISDNVENLKARLSRLTIDELNYLFEKYDLDYEVIDSQSVLEIWESR